MHKLTPYWKKYRTKLTAAGLIVLLAVSGAGCDRASDFFGNVVQSPSVKTKTVSDIAVAMASYASLNPFISKDEDVFYMEKLIYDGLVKLNDEYIAEPNLAESWEYAQDGGSITFRLKKDVYWHDGEKLTAKDVKFSIEALMSARSAGLSLYSQYVSGIKSVKQDGERNITIQFHSGQNNSIENFVFPIVPSHKFRGVSDALSAKNSFVPVGSGPYKVSEITKARMIKLIPSDNYHGAGTAQNTITFKCVPHKYSAIELLRINDINAMISKETDRAVLFAGKDLNVINYPSGEAEILGFNFNNQFLGDEKVRKAIGHCLDVPAIIETAYMGNGVPSQNVFPANYYGSNPMEALLEYDLNTGEELIREAGYYDINRDMWIDDLDGKNVSLKIIVNANDEPRQIVAEMLKGGLEKLNIKSTITVMDWESYTRAINQGDYDLFVGGFSLSDRMDFDFLLGNSKNNPAKYENSTIDEYLDKIKTANTVEERKEAFRKVEALLNEQIPYFCLLYKTYSMITTQSMEGNLEVLWFDPYRNLTDWKYTYEIPAGS